MWAPPDDHREARGSVCVDFPACISVAEQEETRRSHIHNPLFHYLSICRDTVMCDVISSCDIISSTNVLSLVWTPSDIFCIRVKVRTDSHRLSPLFPLLSPPLLSSQLVCPGCWLRGWSSLWTQSELWAQVNYRCSSLFSSSLFLSVIQWKHFNCCLR